jgi:hypothetical protein
MDRAATIALGVRLQSLAFGFFSEPEWYTLPRKERLHGGL